MIREAADQLAKVACLDAPLFASGSCVERTRKVTRARSFERWVPDRLCRVCRAWWFAENAARLVEAGDGRQAEDTSTGGV